MRKCKKCKELKEENSNNFNLLPSGNYRGTCKSCMAANTKKHYDKNPEKVMARVAKYKKQKEAAGGYCSDEQSNKIRLSQEDRCYYCDIPLKNGGELDHKVPVSRDGNNWPENMAWACKTCNRDKHNKTVEEFMSWRKQRNLPCRIKD
jgi:5-methylcytosine-specific restriction endonuclease McrA